ncbi:HipA N-terminal domain-containing protein [Fibrobacter sp. UWB13]|uniref:HipA N-terminal domain-containing protein n=1 Tax=Fibrobacter sp. UWB13 TaxID=1896204 RepID=UPI000A0EB4D0|nr:HipA N-terminal domain-containing protein [Fibrobacter sp. UWB13]SMG39117.1 serine/threonine-protein kinase HipA [Fibrobacter sp. UWB13]
MNNYFFKPVRKAVVYYNDILAGRLLLNRGRYTFIYDLKYMSSGNPSIALDMPKRKRYFCSPYLFPFFQGLLPEGENKSFLCERLGISRSDKFTMLVKLANHETIGAITVREGDV